MNHSSDSLESPGLVIIKLPLSIARIVAMLSLSNLHLLIGQNKMKILSGELDESGKKHYKVGRVHP